MIRNSYEASQAFGKKIKYACRLYFLDHKAVEAGAWGCQIPNKFLPVYIQGGTCSTLCDVSGAYADFGRHASAKKGFLGNSDAQALVRFLMGNVISGFSVRRVYDRVLYNRRADMRGQRAKRECLRSHLATAATANSLL